MKGDKKVIQFLNKALTVELTAINQYFLHARMYKNWGLNALGKHEYEESIEEMKHAQTLMDRILFLDGLPNLQRLGKLQIGESVPEMFQADLGLEVKGRDDLKRGIELCLTKKDHGTREILEHILTDSEEHIDWIESQIEVIGQIGKEHYLAQHLHG